MGYKYCDDCRTIRYRKLLSEREVFPRERVMIRNCSVFKFTIHGYLTVYYLDDHNDNLC